MSQLTSHGNSVRSPAEGRPVRENNEPSDTEVGEETPSLQMFNWTSSEQRTCMQGGRRLTLVQTD